MFILFSAIDGRIEHSIIAQYDDRYPDKCQFEISKWAMNVPVPEYAELKYLKKIKIIDEKNDLGESGYNLFEGYLYQQKYRYIFSIYVVCAGQRSSSIPTFINATYPPILLITNIEATTMFHVTFTYKTKSEHQLAKILERQQK